MSKLKHLKLLIIEHNEQDFLTLVSMLKSIKGSEHWVIERTDEYAVAMDHICKQNYQIYLIDIFLGEKTGIDLLTEAIEKGCIEPIIILTSNSNREIDLQSMEHGAVDYLEKKDMNAEKLERSIRYAMERSNAMNQLREKEKKYRQVFEQSHDTIFIADAHLQFTEVNPAMELLLGYSEEEFLQLSLFDLLVDNGKKEIIANSFLRDYSIIDEELILHTKGNKEIVVLFSGSLLKDSSGKLIIQGMLHNITSLKKAEKATLIIEKLSANRRLAQFLAHEIRNPLVNIKLSVYQLKKLMASESEHYLDIVHRNGERIHELVDKLLIFSQSSEYNFTSEILQDIIDSSLAEAADRISLKSVQLITNLHEHKIYIKADKEKLSIALLNIINNAIEALNKKPAQLVITLEPAGHNFCLLKITDNGKGMSALTQERLFEPYYTTKESGIGLGLTATAAIVEAHKGIIEVVSLEGTGTSFNIQFPLV